LSIEGLEKIRELYFKEDGTFKENNRSNLIDYFMKTTIDTFKEFKGRLEEVRKQADDNWRALQYYEDHLVELNKKFKNYLKANKESKKEIKK